ncbi:MAG: hypothetical protein LBE01_01665, partial [Deltaproteobacteria bacterium]|nr:hypothetical protein [Deltaproteobacteria bacterium]
MRIKFWGVRGSIPCPPSKEDIRAKILAALKLWPGGGDPEAFLDSLPPYATGPVGGNTICLEMSDDEDLLIFDAGTGLRDLGHSLVASTLTEIFEQFFATEKMPLIPVDRSPNGE